jgi:hypothetical protein
MSSDGIIRNEQELERPGNEHVGADYDEDDVRGLEYSVSNEIAETNPGWLTQQFTIECEVTLLTVNDNDLTKFLLVEFV